MMGEFKIGDRVRIANSLATELNGCEGVIDRLWESSLWRWGVILDGAHNPMGFNDNELAPAQPAPVQAAGEIGYTPVEPGLALTTFLEGWLASPLHSIYKGREIVVSHAQKDDVYQVTVDGGIVAFLGAGEFWRTVAEAQTTKLAAAEALADERLRELVVLEGERNRLRQQVKTATETANDYRDQIWVHQGTLRVLKSWLSKADGFSAEDGFTEASILGMVANDLEASEKMDTRTLVANG